MLRRVVITGMGAVSPFGLGVDLLVAALRENRTGVAAAPEFRGVGGLRSFVKGAVPPFDEKTIPRKHRRAMSPMSIYATLAAREAVEAAGLGGDALKGGRTGVCIGSTLGSPETLETLFREFVVSHSLEQMKSTLFFQIMGHSCAANVSQALGVAGRVVAPSGACTTGCQAAGLAYEMIAAGFQDTMICGGADELHTMTTATFDIINAASSAFNDRPGATPRPFDRDRDGVVCSEGAGILVLEELGRARARGGAILAEVKGFATMGDPSNMANPDSGAMAVCMERALESAGLAPRDIDYVNAHATGTVQGDAAEAEAVAKIFGDTVPVSSLKGHLGHTMAASGALELIATVAMMDEGTLFATRNLEAVDPACAAIRHATPGEARTVRYALKNSFAMGGVNSSMVVGRMFP